ncbi:MAG: hypothetical protein NTV23_07590 [Propionibacteriales bacterium]|nr:hypothetical protein [Propionibacteriales bacterium]
MTLIHQVPLTSLLHGHCRHCGRPIVFAPGSGWIDPWPGDSYDLCPENEYGNHQPDVQSPVEARHGQA